MGHTLPYPTTNAETSDGIRGCNPKKLQQNRVESYANQTTVSTVGSRTRAGAVDGFANSSQVHSSRTHLQYCGKHTLTYSHQTLPHTPESSRLRRPPNSSESSKAHHSHTCMYAQVTAQGAQVAERLAALGTCVTGFRRTATVRSHGIVGLAPPV